jgi:cytoplasmic iron level regulating protein YaaA (DUF328/UPF0246 family)
MLTLLSPAKSLNPTPHDGGQPSTEPRFAAATEKLVAAMKKKSPKQIAALMEISPALSDLNYQRYQGFEAQDQTSAAFLFDGDVYDGLQARTLDSDALAFAQEHIRILSGLYGVLRPLDLIRPYRLEMGTALKVGRASSLYQFWGETLADSLRAEAADGVLLNLASQEYSKAALTKKLGLKVISPRFLEVRGNQAKIVSFFAKKARGLMARYIIDQRIDRPEGVKDFGIEGYAFRPDLSHDGDWVFTRAQPVAKAA